MHRTQNQRELAEIYTAADVFVNPAAQDYRVNSDNVSLYYYSTNVENNIDIHFLQM